MRAKPEKFAEHFAQATLFFESQSEAEQRHIAEAFRFELSKLTVPAVRQRVVAMLRNASEPLAAQVAAGLGMPLPEKMPRVFKGKLKPEVSQSPALSLLARPGEGGIRTRRVALLIADGSREADVLAVQEHLTGQGAMVRLMGPHVGMLQSEEGSTLDADASLENEPGVLFDGIAVAGGQAAAEALSADVRALEHLRDAYRHGKPLLLVGEGAQVWRATGLPEDEQDSGVIVADMLSSEAADAFVSALASPRNPDREPNLVT